MRRGLPSPLLILPYLFFNSKGINNVKKTLSLARTISNRLRLAF